MMKAGMKHVYCTVITADKKTGARTVLHEKTSPLLVDAVVVLDRTAVVSEAGGVNPAAICTYQL
jgi:hypothetical protein